MAVTRTSRPGPMCCSWTRFPAMRAATADTLADIADSAYGINCGMAMLMINRIFDRTWGGLGLCRAGPGVRPAVLGELRARRPDTVMIAEAYWDKEWELQQHGFNFCYDKRLYDRIIGQDASAVRDHLRADLSYQSGWCASWRTMTSPASPALPADAERSAAVAIATLPGATLWHEGQFEGRRVRPPVFLPRRPDEPPDLHSPARYHRLLAAVDPHQQQPGAWRLLQASGRPATRACATLAAWLSGQRHAGEPAPGWSTFPGSTARRACRWTGQILPAAAGGLTDILGPSVERDGGELASPGLFVTWDRGRMPSLLALQ